MKTSAILCCLFVFAACQARAAELLTSESGLLSNRSTRNASPSAPVLQGARGERAASAVWPQDRSDIRPDPNVVWGRLDNGLRYAILPTRALPGHASMQLYMRAGALMETDKERGLAHFLEHMAFNGTKNFPAGELVKFFQHLGMTFGPHANAFTSWDRTVYELELPRADVEFVNDGLNVFHDFLDGMLLEPKEVDRERRVIFSEILASNTASYRAAVAELNFGEPSTLLPARMPVGQVSTVGALRQPQFVEFYQKWYTPGRAMIVAVGDLNVKQIEGLIRQKFAGIKARRGEQPSPTFGSVLPIAGPIAGFHNEPDAALTSVELFTAVPHSHEADSVARCRDELVRGVVNTMLNSRLAKISASKNAPFQAAGAGFDTECNLVDLNSLTASCQPKQWQAALAAIEQELRRAEQFGFSDAEFVRARSTVLAIFQSAADQAETSQPASLAAEIVGSIAADRVFTNPAQDLKFAKAVLAELKPEDCRKHLQLVWNPTAIRIWVQGNAQIAGDASRQILAAYRESQASVVRAPADEQAARLTLADIGPAGTIVERKQVAGLDFVQATLSNNVRVNVKRTSFEKNAVYIRVRFGGGFLEEPADKPELGLLASAAFMRGGLRSISMTELNQVLADKNVGLSFSVGDSAFEFDGSCSPALLEMDLNLCAAYMTQPGYREESRDRFLASSEAMYAHFERSIEGVMSNRGVSFLHSDDSRFSIPSREAVGQLTLADVRSWLAEPLRRGYMEVVIVGDVNVDEALRLTAKTLGALPERQTAKPAYTARRDIRFPLAPKVKEFRVDSSVQRAMTMVCWPTTGARDLRLARRIRVLSAVLENRIWNKIRQELGATYTPSVEAYSADAFPDYGYVSALATIDPKRVGEIGPLMAEIAAGLTTKPITDDEFQRAIKPIARAYETLQNGYWYGLLTDCQESSACLDDARKVKADLASITKVEIQSLAKRYLSAGKATIVNVVPK